MTERQVLFVPQHQGGGTGEFHRLLAVAEALHERDPSVAIRFLMPRNCPLIARLGFPVIESDQPDEQRAAFHVREIERLRPTIAVFDQACRSGTLGRCRQLGVQVVCATFEPGTSDKTFRLDWLWRLDEHWHQQFRIGDPPLGRWQRLLAAISSTRRLHFDVCHAEPKADDGAGLPQAPLVLFVPGGGGYRIDGRSVGALFADAGQQVAFATGIPVQVVGASGDETPRPGVEWLDSLPQAALIARMRRATVVVTGGGGGALPQALSVCSPSVAVPLGGSDQADRVQHLAACGWCLAAEPEASRIAIATLALLADDDLRRTMRERLAVLALRNGLPMMVEALLQRLDAARPI